MTITITTNNVPRDVIDAYQLTPKERAEFDYLDWTAIDEGSESASFFRYHGRLYDLAEFTWNGGEHRMPNLPAIWEGYLTDSFFSAIVVRYVNDNEQVIVGMVLS